MRTKFREWRAQRLQKRAEKAIPGCASFLSKMWGLPPERFIPNKVRVQWAPSVTDSPAHVDVSKREIIFTEPCCSSTPIGTENFMQHEMAHIGFPTYEMFCLDIPFRDIERSNLRPERQGMSFRYACLSECLPVLSEYQQYHSLNPQRRIQVRQKILLKESLLPLRFSLLTGKSRLSSSQYAYAHTPHEIARNFTKYFMASGMRFSDMPDILQKNKPEYDELFFPSLYLQYLGLVEPDAAAISPALARDLSRGWIEESVHWGTTYPWEALYENGIKKIATPAPEIRISSLGDRISSKIDNLFSIVIPKTPRLAQLPLAKMRPFVQSAENILRALWALISYPVKAVSLLFRKTYPGLPMEQPIRPYLLPCPRKHGCFFVHEVEEKLEKEAARKAIKENPPKTLEEILEPEVYIKRIINTQTENK